MRIEYKGIRVKLGGQEILKGVDLATEENKIVGIIGPNGCGKSTLIKTTFGICSRSGGSIFLDGKDIGGFSPRKLASMIGYVGQDAACTFDFSVEDVVAMGLYARNDKSVPPKKIVTEALEELEITHFRDRSIMSLSGGERKMVFIARAIAQGADTLILDEPTNHLDIKHQIFLLDYLKKSGRTILIVLHDLRLAAHYCDRIYLLKKGENLADGIPTETLSEENVDRVFGIKGKAYINVNGQMDFDIF